MLGLKITRTPRTPREPRGPRIAWVVAGWNPALAATIVVTAGLIIHEVVYHLAGGDDYPLQVFANGWQVFAMSHGGLDALGIGLLVVSALWVVDFAHTKARRPA